MKHQAVRLSQVELSESQWRRLNDPSPTSVYAIGKTEVLNSASLGLLCSVQCPGSVVMKTYDTIRALREDGVVVIGGFHSPMERECLDILLRGEQPVILCPAKGLYGLRLGSCLRNAIETGRLLLLSPFDVSVRRTTARQAAVRNRLVAALAHDVFVPYASPAGKCWSVVEAAVERGQTVYTVEDEENAVLFQCGAVSVPLPLIRSNERRANDGKDAR